MAKLDLMCISNTRLRNEIERGVLLINQLLFSFVFNNFYTTYFHFTVGLFSIEKIMLMGNHELMEIGNFSTNDINTLKSIAAKSILPDGFRNGK